MGSKGSGNHGHKRRQKQQHPWKQALQRARDAKQRDDWYDGNDTRCGYCGAVVYLGHACAEDKR